MIRLHHHHAVSCQHRAPHTMHADQRTVKIERHSFLRFTRELHTALRFWMQEETIKECPPPLTTAIPAMRIPPKHPTRFHSCFRYVGASYRCWDPSWAARSTITLCAGGDGAPNAIFANATFC